MHREIDLLNVDSLIPLSLVAFLFGWGFGLAGESLLRRIRPERGGRRPRATAFAAGYAGGAIGFAVAAAGVALLLLVENATR
ncbi:hypothetical protein LzC2_12230 [Planctomycetes bacterium LzC2]|uniref:Uncharacterized protein n=2 Tax=Alienimonas chondri TaxID=2681879 RepID=A0ABX1VCC9_9PLAN|nr:hypothetical protein [Alienimonas chondri]